jgi:DNA polymerase-1
MNRVGGHGNPNAKLMVIGEAPGAVEDNTGIPFSGPSGDILNELLEEGGTTRDEVWVTNVCPYRPPDNKIYRLKEIGVNLEECVQNLWKEIKFINPNCIIPLGETALRAVTDYKKISHYRGSILQSREGYPKVVPTYHPAHLLYQEEGEITSYSAKAYMGLDFKRAYEQSQFKEFRLPNRNLVLCKNYSQLRGFLDAHRGNYKFAAIDIEAIKCIPVCVGIAFSPHNAISVPLLNIKSYKNPLGIGSVELALMWRELAEFLADPDILKVGQNFKYDEKRLASIGFVVNGFYHDTMLCAGILAPEFPKSLAFLTSIYTEEPYYKNEGEEFQARKADINKLLLYNAKDAAVTIEIFLAQCEELQESQLYDFFYGFQMHLHRLYSDIEEEGFDIDEEARIELLKKYHAEWDKDQAKLDFYAGHSVNVNSSDQVCHFLYEEVKFPKRGEYKDGVFKVSSEAKVLAGLLNNHARTESKREILELILRIRKIRKTISTYLLAKPDFDGRTKTQYNIVGTETGRTSTSILEQPVRIEKLGQSFQTLTKHGEVGADLRTMYVPDPGYVLLEADLSQAEARVVALLSEDYELLELFDKLDIHKKTASWIFNKDMLKITSEERFLGKTIRHAGNYDMKKRRCAETISVFAQKFKIDVQVSEWLAGKHLETFHQYSPKIRGVFHENVRQKIYYDRTLVNPFGRKRQFFERMGEDLFKEAYAYLPQSTVSDHLKRCMLRLKQIKPDLRICVEAHDGFLAQVPVEQVSWVKIWIKDVLETPINFEKSSLGTGSLIIPCDIKTSSTNWKELAA